MNSCEVSINVILYGSRLDIRSESEQHDHVYSRDPVGRDWGQYMHIRLPKDIRAYVLVGQNPATRDGAILSLA